jgi:hypothetical protein
LVTESNHINNVMKKDVIGMVRLILSPPFPLKLNFELWSRESAEIQDIPDANQCEISAFCWAPKNGANAIPYIYRAIRQCTKTLHKTILLAALDQKLIPVFQSQMFPIHVCGNSRYYMGSDTVPLFIKTAEIMDTLLAKNSQLFQFIEKELDIHR